MDKKTFFSVDLINILKKAFENKIYGSVEIFFESGNITQITQRVIKKISSHKTNNSSLSSKITNSNGHKDRLIDSKLPKILN